MTLRLPDELHAALKGRARASGRSLHAEVIWRLRLVEAGAAQAFVELRREEGSARFEGLGGEDPSGGVGADGASIPVAGVSASAPSSPPSPDPHFRPDPKPGKRS